MMKFFDQAKLMLTILPVVGQEEAFALKGGTALNFFYFDMPRLSVDIDLTFLPIKPRDETLSDISESLSRITDKIGRFFPNYQVQKIRLKGTEHIYKLIVSNGKNLVKIEPNMVLRGSCYPPEYRPLCQKASEIFNMEMEIRVLSIADLYGGKLCAALDRQHPRDLFDIKLLQETNGLNERIVQAFVVYLASHNRPMAELLAPNFQDFKEVFENEFKGMASIDVRYEELETIARGLANRILSGLSGNERKFLLSVKTGKPDFSLLSLPGIESLPAIKWKVENILKMKPEKKNFASEKLKMLLYESR
jgi:predicted nucleotidyltransferase component of viral defense system